MTAVKHGNGKDWWLIKPHMYKNKLYKFLVTSETVSLYDSTDFGDSVEIRFLYGQSVFSQNGTQYASVVETNLNDYVYYWQFDRCTGQFSNYKKYHVPFNRDTLGDFQNGVAFSPNERFLYVSSRYNIWQIDLQDTSLNNYVHIAGPDTIKSYFQQYMNLKLAPNGNIYVGNRNNVPTWSYIANPNAKGLACNFVPRGLWQPYTSLTIPPNMPNYELGVLAGSPCDTIRAQVAAWQLYPNPAHTIIQLKVPNSSNGQVVAIQIHDMLGKLVAIKDITVNYEHEARINIAHLAQGLYYLKVRHSSDVYFSKFVVN
jgi:Secretion system C-terminal sorting domain